ncbi:hypothetical protein ACP70R_045219 [Stipagrostis hirtigluma subsp. patula]
MRCSSQTKKMDEMLNEELESNKNATQEDIVPKLCDLQDIIDHLVALNIQLETEVPVLWDGLEKMDEALGTTRAELQKKISELEQLDKNHLSVKEKLSIAVAKGKGLIVQRDSLKQSLLEKSGEIEKLTKTLQAKDALLKESVEEIHVSKIYLQDIDIFYTIPFDKWSFPLPTLIKEEIVPKLCDLQDIIDQLVALNIQLETEVPVLWDGLEKMDEALGSTRAELEKLDQNQLSVKEKLSIAVAKGKGLIVQRDNLKQSLLEKSGEIEKLTKKLQSKDALLNEFEARLKSDTEVDRIEALESELSYIRNSATALRDSFLQKDSVLQRIEEVLEDLDLPEQFHSRDIVEKIELLSKMAIGASFTPDGDKRSSVDGYSKSSAATDGTNDEQNSNSNLVSHEVHNKYDELQRRFYELAEHNDMLEQSLVERNSLIQKWEEVLGQISIPPQFRTLEAEDKIAWIGNRLLEVEHERDSLQLKIEHLEDSSEMLIADLEESHKKISELSAEVVAIKAEKDFFSQSLDKLRFEFLGLTEKAVQDEFVRDNLQKDVSELQEKLAEKNEESKHYHDIDLEIQKLLDLVQNILPDHSELETSLGATSPVLCLGKLLSKLLDNYATLLSKSTVGTATEREVHLDETKSSNDLSTSEIRDDKEMELSTLNNELDHARNSLALVEQQRDEAVKNAQSLMLEIDSLHAEINKLEESGAEQVQKYHSLVLEMELASNRQDNLQEQLNQKQQQHDEAVEKAQSLRLEIETLHDQINKMQESDAVQMQRYQSLVDELESASKQRDDLQKQLSQVQQQRDDLQKQLNHEKQQRDEAMEKAQSLMLEIETLHAQINKLQESGAEQTQKYQSLVLELESANKKQDSLQEQLNQEEQKCASLREKLNVAVRKGKGLVQHRDSLKQTMEEMNAVIEKLKSERKQHIESLESEKSSLMGRIAENEKSLHDTNQYLSRLLDALNKVDVAREFDTDPITKVEKLEQLFHDVEATVVSSQNEAKKSKQAMELLLAELNEAHERADNLQEELVKAEVALSESSKQNSVIESARADAVHHLEHIMYVQSQTRRKQVDHLMQLNSTSGQLREVCFELSHCLVNAFSKDLDLISYMESFMKSSGKWLDGANMVDIPIISKHVLSSSMNSKNARIPNAPLELKMDDLDESQILHHLAITCHALSDCVKDCNDLKRSMDEHAFLVEQKATELFDVMSNLQNRFSSQTNELQSLREKFVELQSEMKEKDDEIVSMRRNMSLLYEACTNSIAEIEGMTGIGPGNRSYFVEHSPDDYIKSMVEQLVVAVKTSRNSNEGSKKELKATILELQQDLQAKDVQIGTIASELSSQIREAESSAKQLSLALEDARMEVRSLEKQVDVLHNQKKALETQVNEIKDMEVVASEQHGRIQELTDELSRKDQEIEGLMQALDEEEKELEVLENKGHDLEKMLQEKEFALNSLEVSRMKALAKLATTVDKFDELHSLSESLLVEVENLQSQLQERDSEISFLRQEVTRSTNELLATEESNKKYASQINDFIKWLETALLQFDVHCESADDCDCTQVPVYMDMLDKKIGSLIAESNDLKVIVQSKDSLLQVERTKMEELIRKSEALEASLSQKDSQIGLLRRDRTSSQPSRSINLPGTSEIEQMNEKVSPAAVVTQIRGARKVNNDQVAIDVEMEKDKPLDDEDDDKAHGFKSLTMSHFVPKFTRPISDRIDGMWVSGDRLLMRQPTLRLGVLIYWIALHALLASFI